jgi:hypothetical protein
MHRSTSASPASSRWIWPRHSSATFSASGHDSITRIRRPRNGWMARDFCNTSPFESCELMARDTGVSPCHPEPYVALPRRRLLQRASRLSQKADCHWSLVTSHEPLARATSHLAAAPAGAILAGKPVARQFASRVTCALPITSTVSLSTSTKTSHDRHGGVRNRPLSPPLPSFFGLA